MGDDDAKRIILKRRARFIAAALSCAAATSACGEPQPCLEPPFPEPRDAGFDAPDTSPPPVDANLPD